MKKIYTCELHHYFRVSHNEVVDAMLREDLVSDGSDSYGYFFYEETLKKLKEKDVVKRRNHCEK